jgi:hypothetical protein
MERPRPLAHQQFGRATNRCTRTWSIAGDRDVLHLAHDLDRAGPRRLVLHGPRRRQYCSVAPGAPRQRQEKWSGGGPFWGGMWCIWGAQRVSGGRARSISRRQRWDLCRRWGAGAARGSSIGGKVRRHGSLLTANATKSLREVAAGRR